MDLPQTLLAHHHDRYGEAPRILVRAPGRVNIIGEHTDYNDGFVLPMAIQLGIWVALRPRHDRRIILHSLNYEGITDFSLRDVDHVRGWGEYVRGIAWALIEAGYPVSGWEGMVAGDIPTGAGLSSSAALELALIKAFWSVSGWAWKARDMALLARKAENAWVGVQSGVMDQMIAALGKENHALLLDCRSLDHSWVPMIEGTSFLILDTGTRRGLVESIYNRRVEECRAAAAIFGTDSLRAVSLQELESKAGQMPESLYKRAHHVVSENARTRQAARAMRDGQPEKLGQLMNASHASLRDDYRVSSPELDQMVDLVRQRAGTYGARMTGAGFGGAAIALVQSSKAQEISHWVQQAYPEVAGTESRVIIARAARGAERIS